MTPKPSLTVVQQVDLLKQRGLEINDFDICKEFLTAVNYYRFSGYARYFQRDPMHGDNRFKEGTSFEQIRQIFDLDAQLRTSLTNSIAQVELLLRTHVARAIADTYGPCGKYLEESFYTEVGDGATTVDAILSNIERSREYHILRFSPLLPEPRSFDDLPIWSAIEAFSFGTLSKCVERGASGKLQEMIASSVSVPKTGFASRIKAIVYLRNRCFHHGRLWKHSVINAGMTPNNVRVKAKRIAGQFQPQSVLDVIASLDDLALRGGLASPVLPGLFSSHGNNIEFWDGLKNPRSLPYLR